jgi:hypothetical protein
MQRPFGIFKTRFSGTIRTSKELPNSFKARAKNVENGATTIRQKDDDDLVRQEK